MIYNSNPSNSSNQETFIFPASVQSDLFLYLKPEQQSQIRPILRILKKPAQMELCTSLMDYLESGDRTAPADFALAAIFNYLTEQWSPLHVDHHTSAGSEAGDDSSRYEVITPEEVFTSQQSAPLTQRTCKPVRLGDILRKLFPSLFKV